MLGLQGLGWDALVGLVGLTLVLSASLGFGPLKAWFATRAHGFWGWLVMVMGEQLWVGFWVGFWWSVYSGNRLFESILFGGGIAVISHATHEALTYLSATANSRARGYAQARAREAAASRPRQQLPNSRDPRLSEAEAHAIMDAYDDDDPKAPGNNPTLN